MRPDPRRLAAILLVATLAGLLVRALWPAPPPPDLTVDLAPGLVPLIAPPHDLPDMPVLSAISGTVRDGAGLPLAGAQVCAFPWSRQLAVEDTHHSHCTRSERDGHYHLAALLPAPHRVGASAPGHVPATHGKGWRATVTPPPGGELPGIDLVLPGGGVEISGLAQDLSGGPIEGAVIELAGAVAFSDSNGHFRLWCAPGHQGLTARADGYAEGHGGGIAPIDRFDVTLIPESVLVGKVVHASNGAPVEGARIDVEGGDFGGRLGPVFTDAAGRFRLGGLRPGTYKASAETDNSYGLAPERTIVGLGETSPEIIITAHPAFSVTGKIVTASGQPCIRGELALSAPGRMHGRSADAEPDGSVHVRGLLPGKHRVQVTCTGHVPETSYPPITLVDRSLTGQRWDVTTGHVISGQIVDAHGSGVAGITVSAAAQQDPQHPDARRTYGTSQPSETTGHFQISGLLPGRFELTAQTTLEARPLPPATLVTLADKQDLTDLRIVLPATGAIRGSVKDNHGHGLAAVEVALRGIYTQRSTFTAQDGSFTLAHAPLGAHRIVATKNGHPLRAPGSGDDDLQGVPVIVRARETITAELVVETADVSLSGRVEDGGGPVADAFIQAVRESESAAASGQIEPHEWDRSAHDRVLSDLDGRFTISGLPAGKYALRAQRRGGGEAIATHVTSGSDVTLTITAGARVSGLVTTASGRPPDELLVVLRETTTGATQYDRVYRNAGKWALADLPPGHYLLSASAPEGASQQELDLAAGETLTDVHVTLTPFVTLRGTVTDLDGAPITNLVVRVAEQATVDTGVPYNPLTDAAGRFELTGIPAARIHVSVMSPDPATGGYLVTNLVADLDPTRTTAELPPIRIAKPRVRPGATAGDRGYTLRKAPDDLGPGQARLLIAVVRPRGPAATAGLHVGDEIVAIDGHDVTGDGAHLHDTMLAAPAGTTLTLTLARGASVTLTLGPP